MKCHHHLYKVLTLLVYIKHTCRTGCACSGPSIGSISSIPTGLWGSGSIQWTLVSFVTWGTGCSSGPWVSPGQTLNGGGGGRARALVPRWTITTRRGSCTAILGGSTCCLCGRGAEMSCCALSTACGTPWTVVTWEKISTVRKCGFTWKDNEFKTQRLKTHREM